MDYIMGIASCVIIIWLGSILSILAHEAGHILGYLLSAGKELDDWYVTVGRGKEIFKTKRLLICSPSAGILNAETIFQKSPPC